MSAGSEHVAAAASAVLEVLQPLAGRDWSVRAGGLEWSCARTAAHIAHDLIKYAAQLAGRCDESYLRFKVVVAPDEASDEILRIVGASARVLVASVAAASDDARAWHYGPADRSGFAAMGVAELLVHTYDITSGFGADWRPAAELAELVLARLMPEVPRDDAASALLWATGRIDVEGLPHADTWVWHAAV